MTHVYFSVAPRAKVGPHEIKYDARPWPVLRDALLASYEFRAHDGTPQGLKDAKLSCPMISPATFVDGARKEEANVTGVHWLMLDFDDVQPAAFTAALGKLESEGIAAFSYSTWSQPEAAHAGLVRARVGMPISRPCTPLEWRTVYYAALAKYGASGTDSRCSDPSRFYFVPALPAGTEWAASTWRATGQGVVDVDTLVREYGRTHEGIARRAVTAGMDPIPRDALVRLERKLNKSLRTEDIRAGQFLRAALDGHGFAVMGQRHAAKLTLSMFIARAFPTGNPSQIAEYFRTSFDLMRDGSEREDPCDKFAGLLESAQSKVFADIAEVAQAQVLLAQTNVVKAWEGQGIARDTPYTEAEYIAATKALGLMHPSELKSRWVVQCGDWVHILFLHPDGPRYLPPASKTNVHTSIAQNLAPAATFGFTAHRLDKNGAPVPKTLEQFVTEYGRVVHHSEMSMLAPASYLDARRSCLVEATTPLVKLEPEYDEEIDEWLALLAGDANPQFVASKAARFTKASRLCDWLAVVTDLSKPAPAVFFKGGPGSGKTLFAEGLARLWGAKTPTGLRHVIGNSDYNQALVRCPLILGDEKVPETFRGEPKTEELRELITKSTFELNRKFRDIVTLEGSIRLILAANNFNMIARKGEFTPEDAQALADRFILIEPNPLAVEYLKQKGARAFTDTWTDGLRFARHVHWLRAHNEAGIRPIERGTRLYVPGDAALLTDALQTATRVPWSICFWLWSFLRNQAVHVSSSTGRPLAAIVARQQGGASALWVSSEHLVQSWDHYLQGERPPPRETLLGAIRNVTVPRTDARLRRDVRGPVHSPGRTQRVEYSRVRLEALVQWAERAGEDTSCVSEWLTVETETLGTPGPGGYGMSGSAGTRPN
jgi:hypothetical protein